MIYDVCMYYVDKPTTVQQGGVGLGYVRVRAKGKQDRRRVRSSDVIPFRYLIPVYGLCISAALEPIGINI